MQYKLPATTQTVGGCNFGGTFVVFGGWFLVVVVGPHVAGGCASFFK